MRAGAMRTGDWARKGKMMSTEQDKINLKVKKVKNFFGGKKLVRFEPPLLLDQKYSSFREEPKIVWYEVVYLAFILRKVLTAISWVGIFWNVKPVCTI